MYFILFFKFISRSCYSIEQKPDKEGEDSKSQVFEMKVLGAILSKTKKAG